MDTGAEFVRIDSLKSADFIVPKIMHSNGYVGVLSIRRIPNTYICSDVIFDKLVRFCRNER